MVRSFVLERAEGNVIVYHSPGVAAAREDIQALGRPAKLLVNHWHEAMFEMPDLDVPPLMHEADRARTDVQVAGAFSEGAKVADELA